MTHGAPRLLRVSIWCNVSRGVCSPADCRQRPCSLVGQGVVVVHARSQHVERAPVEAAQPLHRRRRHVLRLQEGAQPRAGEVYRTAGGHRIPLATAAQQGLSGTVDLASFQEFRALTSAQCLPSVSTIKTSNEA